MKSSILWYPYFWKHPYVYSQRTKAVFKDVQRGGEIVMCETLPKNWGLGLPSGWTNIGPKNKLSQKESSFSTSIFQALLLIFGRGRYICSTQPTPIISSSAPPVRQQLNSSPLDYSKSNLLEPPGRCGDQSQLHPSLQQKNVPTFSTLSAVRFFWNKTTKMWKMYDNFKKCRTFEDESHVVNSYL